MTNMRYGSFVPPPPPGDDLYFMLMWRRFVCLSVAFRHHADLYIMLMWSLTWRPALPWIVKLSPKAPELSPLKKQLKNYISLQNAPYPN